MHPRDRSARVLAAAAEHGTHEMLQVFRGRRIGSDDDRAFVARHWDLDRMAERYQAFLDRFGGFERQASRMSPDDAFLLRFAVVFEHLETAWEDPDLPTALLPPRWPGVRARELARGLYTTLLPRAIEFGDRITHADVARSRRR